MRLTKVFVTRRKEDFEEFQDQIDKFIAYQKNKVFKTTYITGALRYDGPALYCIIEYTTDDIEHCELCYGVIINDKCVYCGGVRK
jgi:hypothetical protein